MKYFFFDIDGTLTNIHTGEFVQSGLDTIKQLEANGNFTAIVTGRAYYKTIAAAAEAGIHNYIANGGAALILNDKLIRNEPIDRTNALALIHQAEELGFGLLVSVDDSKRVLMKDQKFIEQVGKRQEPTEYELRPDLDYDSLEEIYKVYIAVPKEREEELITRKKIGYVRFVQDYLIFQHDKKDQGIRAMLKEIGGDPKDVVVFGDAENDMIMFGKEWTSIAMGNGYQPLKDIADYVTDASENDGIRNACLHFGWI